MRNQAEFAVHPDNWDTVQLFLESQSQWRTGPMGGVTGFDYAGIDVMIRRRRLEVTPAMFEGLQIMEAAAAAELNRQLNATGGSRR